VEKRVCRIGSSNHTEGVRLMEEKILDDLTNEEVKELIAAAKAKLEAEEAGKESAKTEGVERKDPTKVAAVDPEDAVNRENEATFGKPAIHPKKPKELKQFSIAKAVRGVALGVWKDADLEKEWVQYTMKELNIEDDTSGGFLVPTELSSELIDKLRAKAVMRAAGALVIPNAPQRLNIPRLTGSATAYWVGQSNSTITASEQTFGQVTLDLRRLAALTKIDEDLLLHSVVSAETVVRNDLVQQIALAEDYAFLLGTGGDQPLGIYNNPEINTTSIGGTPTFDDLIDAMASIEARDGEYNAWLMHSNILYYLRKHKTGAAAYDYVLDLSNTPPNRILGLPVYTTSQIPVNLGAGGNESFIVLGNFPDFAIAEGGGIEIKVLRERYAEHLQIGIRAVHRVDGVPRQPDKFQILTGVTTS